MFLSSWSQVFSQSLLELWYEFINFMPKLLGSVILFVIGCIVASVVGKALAQVISLTRVDKLFERAEKDSFMSRAGFKFSLSKFIGAFIKWFIIVVFFIASLQILGLHDVNLFLNEIVISYLPKVLVVAIVLVVATILADVTKRFITGSARGAKISSANMLGTFSYYSIWIFAFIVVLFELGIAPAFIQTIFTGLVAAGAVAVGLAFGLGGKDAASRIIEKIGKDISNKE